MGVVSYVIGELFRLVRRRWNEGRRHAGRWLMAAGRYLLLAFTAGRLSPRRILAAQEILRYDDWRLGIQKATFTDSLDGLRPETGKRFLVVTVNVFNIA